MQQQIKKERLRQAQMRQAQIRQAQMRQAQMRQAQMRQAQMRQAQMRQAQMRQAQMRQAQMRQAQMRQAQMRQAQMRQRQAGATQIQQVQMRQVQMRKEQMQQGQRELNLKYTLRNDKTSKLLHNTKKKIGVVITTNGNNGIFVKQCIECYLRTLPSKTYIILYINESKDPITLELKNIFPSIEVIYVENQKEGGLTGTWNKGIDKCFENNCDIVIISNDDILFDNSISHICLEAAQLKDTDMIYLGPKSNKPGNESNKIQLGLPEDKNSVLCTNNNKLWNINGFLMVMTKSVLKANKFNEKYYFNPEYPFGGNETEWFDRFKKIGGKGLIVPRTYIYHYKLKRWRSSTEVKQDKVCIYTINTGGYEGSEIYLNPNLGYDCLYYTDNFVNVYNCIKKGIIPFYVDTSNKEAKLVQRTIKMNVHEYIPAIYDKSIYIDGNISIKDTIISKNKLKKLLKMDEDIICFDHPDRKHVFKECEEVILLSLETQDNINKVTKNFEKNGFKDNIGLTETNVLIRNHKKLIKFNNDCKLHIEMCRRDQVSFDFLLHKHNVKYNRLKYHDKTMMSEKKPHIDSRKRCVV